MQKRHAWVTSAYGEDEVGKALVLAGSLRRVNTCATLVVIAGRNLSTPLSEYLETAFDLVVGDEAYEGQQGLLQAFTLVGFEKVVYLSPNMVVVSKCDEIFGNGYGQSVFWGKNGCIDPSVMLIFPSCQVYEFLKKKLELCGEDDWMATISKVLKSSFPTMGNVDAKYNTEVKLYGGGVIETSHLPVAIGNFVDGHPWDWTKQGIGLKGPGGLAADHINQVFKELVLLAVELIRAKGTQIKNNGIGEAAPIKNMWSGSGGSSEPIAVVGMGFRLPGGSTEEEFWKLLIQGRHAIKRVPPHRWTKEHSIIPFRAGGGGDSNGVEAGFLDDPIDEFDAKFFGTSPKEAVVLDPQIRLLHEVSWEALEQGGIDPSSLRGSQTGIFVGSWMYNYMDLVGKGSLVQQNLFRVYLGNSVGAESARLAHFFGTTGPAISTESGCSSSMVAVHLGVKSLRNGECNMALACGVNLILHPFTSKLMEGVIAPDFRCKTFDAQADGFARAEGVGALVMKRLSDAVRDGDSIWGLIRGSAVVQEGHSKSLGTPTIHCEALAMELALKDAGVDGGEVSYVEAHGTGTSVGDPMEIAAITKAYKTTDGGRRAEPLIIGSVKTNVGHTESASGITGIIKVLLSMKYEKIPPHLNFESLNPEIELEALPAKLPLEALDWQRGIENGRRRRRIAGVSSFGITGTDGHVIIEEPPPPPSPPMLPSTSESGIMIGQGERPLHLLKLSAKSSTSFEALLNKYMGLLEATEERFEDICYSANTGRATFSHRAVILAKDCRQACKILRDGLFKKAEVVRGGGGGGGALCFLFTGQGSQYPGMAKELYDSSPNFKMNFDRAADMLQSRYSISIKDAMWGSGSSDSGDANNSDLLNQTLYSQTSIFIVEVCLVKLWASWGVTPDYVMGHSLGEFAAAVAGGALEFEDALMLVAERSRLIDSLPGGKMLVIKANKVTVENTIAAYTSSHPDFWVDIAALNSQEQTVVAGNSEMVEAFAKFCAEERELKCVLIASSHAFHSRHMDPIQQDFGKIASSIRRRTKTDANDGAANNLPKYISGMEGKLLNLEHLGGDYWVQNVRRRVNFVEACKTAQSEGVTLFLEMGAHPVLSALTMMNMEGGSSTSSGVVTCLPSLRRKTSDWAVLLESLSKLYLSGWKGSIDWKGFDEGYHHSRRKRVPLPFYPFNKKSIWVEVRPQFPLLHPLLGRLLRTATSQFIYENELGSNSSVGYLQDHVIGNTVIFPGAGFLEMCLAAGYASAHGFKQELPTPRRAIGISNLQILAPLELQESRESILQTTVNLDGGDVVDGGGESSSGGGGGALVTISKFCSDDGPRNQEWTTHATARFHPVLSPDDNDSSSANLKLEVNPARIQVEWEKSDTTEFYQKLPETGFRFGSTFQSLECGWRRGEQGVLFKVKVPQEDNSLAYLIHPVVADAMFQALILWRSKKSKGTETKRKLQVPVSIGEFLWLERWSSSSSSSSSDLFIYCHTTPNEGGGSGGKASAHLVSEDGTLLAFMGDVEFLETTARLVEGLARGGHHHGHHLATSGAIWEEVYRAVPGPLQNRLNCADVHWEDSQTPAFLAQMEQMVKSTQEEHSFHRYCGRLTTGYILNALYRMGWEPPSRNQQPFSAQELLQSLGISPSFEPYINFFLRSLVSSDGLDCLEESGGGEGQCSSFSFSGNNPPPTRPEIEGWLAEPTNNNPEFETRQEFQLIAEIGKNLVGILSGKLHPLSILFPENPEKPSVKGFYEERSKIMEPAMRKVNQELVIGPFAKTVNNSGRGKQSVVTTMRILEIGAGTGSASRIILEMLEKEGINFEYHYTDISPSFFIAAEKEFGERFGKRVIFKKYDMEEDPLSQGFCPGYFDLILALEVLHIAKDVRRMLKRVSVLLKPGGLFQITESLTTDPIIVFIFGLLEGYWQFEDLDFRQRVITLTPPMWEEALSGANFSRIAFFPGYLDVHGMIVCRGGDAAPPEVRLLGPEEPPKFAWILFDDGTPLTSLLEEKFKRVNRQVRLFQRPPGLDSISESHFRGVLSEFIKSGMSADGPRLEGVLYLWGLLPAEEGRDQQQLISLPFLTLCQLVTAFGLTPSVIAVTRGVYPSSDSQVLAPAAATLMGIVKSMNNERGSMNVSAIDLSPNDAAAPASSVAEDIFYNLWGQRTDIYLSREGARLCPRFMMAGKKPTLNDYLPLPNGCERFQLLLPASKLISDLEFTFLDNYKLEEGEIEVEVKAVGLNFRDVMVVMKPLPEFDNFNAIGLDVAGVVSRVGPGVVVDGWKVGDRVAGMPVDGSLALPSHLKMKTDRVIPLPGNMTFVEAATIPVGFFTAYYCLVKVAELKPGDSILIHAASGGVGLCAIRLAQRIGAEVIATAGSNRKRTFLRNLAIKHVFNSRTTQFGQQVLQVTQGRGVSVLLNSLTGPGFKEESLGALGRAGRFVEMSKLNVWREEEVRELRPDVSYTIADLSCLEDSEYKDLYATLRETMRGADGDWSIKPIQYERFDALDIRRALSYLQQAKHVGKIVCVMPELAVRSKKENEKYHERTPMFNADSTYLVTGGLGGIGFEVVKWILRSGGKHVVIASRSPPTPQMAERIEALNGRGGARTVRPLSVDIGSLAQCQQLFDYIKAECPPLRGIMHAAGVLADAPIEDQSWDNFRSTYNPKVNGTWNLHELSKTLLLEHFVLFSSASAVFGSVGQASHSASNCFQDAFAHYRRSLGLPATTINWGNWGEVGVATEIDIPGVTPISTSQGTTALEVCLRSQRDHSVVINIDSVSLLTKLFPRMKTYVEDKRLFGTVSRPATAIINSDEFWAEVEQARRGGGDDDREERVAAFRKHIILVTRNTLNLDPDEVIEPTAEFSSIGVDSLMMLEMKNALQSMLGSRMTLTVAQLKDCTTPEMLANRLVQLQDSQEEEKNLPSTMDELRVLIKEDCVLPDHIMPDPDALLLLPYKPVDQMSTVLLTGVTGSLGPYMLRELTRLPQISKIYCLIRKFGGGKGSPIMMPSERLHSALERAGLLEEVQLDKVECVQGDISKVAFGMAEEEYRVLANDVEAVFHLAGHTDHTVKYWKVRDSGRCSSVRAANVVGTLRVLEFGVEKRLKSLLHISSLVAAINSLNNSGEVVEGCWLENENCFQHFSHNWGYPISKLISEQLVKQAVERGLPCVALRLPSFTGHSATGRLGDFTGSHLHLQLLSLLKLGCVPESPVLLPHIPVDTCAALCLQVALHPDAFGKVYNVRHPTKSTQVLQRQLIAAAKEEFGIGIELVPHPEFLSRLSAAPSGSPLDHFKRVYAGEDDGKLNTMDVDEDDDEFYRRFLIGIATPPPAAGLQPTNNINDNLSSIIPNIDEGLMMMTMEPLSTFLRRDLKYIQAHGGFEKFGIKVGSVVVS